MAIKVKLNYMENENTMLVELSSLARMLGTDRMLSKEDTQKIIAGLFKIIAEFKKETIALNKETVKEVDDILKLITIKQRELIIDVKDGKKELENLYKEHCQEIEYLTEEFKKLKPKDGEPGEKGKDADEEMIIAEVLAQVRAEMSQEEKTVHECEITSDNLVQTINDLDYSKENLIDVRRIKGWENFGKSSKNALSPTVLSNAMDLDSTDRADGYAIVWDETNNRHKYVANAGGGGGSMAIGGSITSATAGSVLFAGPSGVLAQNNAQFFWDNTNNRLGIGTTEPKSQLHISFGTSALDSVANDRGIIITHNKAGKDRIYFEALASTSGQRVFATSNEAGVFHIGSLADNASTWTNQYIIAATYDGKVGLLTNAPTHTLTLASTSTGIALYNTVDQTTNYERVTTSWSSNVFKITSEKGGTGTVRQLVLQTSTRSQIAINDTANATNGFVHLSSSTSTANATGLSALFGSSASSGVSNIVGIFGTLTQSGTAGYTALLVNPTETSTGSGTKLLADFQVAGSSKVKIDNTGVITTLASIELGNASDTTLSRSSAGVLAVEGVVIPSISSTNTLTNKRITPRVTAISSNTGTPAINTDNCDYVNITAQTVNITSMTTSLTGTPTDGQKLWIAMTAGSGTPTVAWGTSFEDPGSLLPIALSTTRVDVGFVWNTATSKWKCVGKV